MPRIKILISWLPMRVFHNDDSTDPVIIVVRLMNLKGYWFAIDGAFGECGGTHFQIFFVCLF